MIIRFKGLFSFSAIAFPAVTGTASGQVHDTRPGIIVFIADDVSHDDLGCYGNRQVKTPNIDRLASEGILFNNVFLTASSSSPSRNSIITGRYPHNTGGEELHSEPPDYMVSFPDLLRKGGYYTAQAGKFHMGKYARRGFETISDNNKLNGDGGEERWLEIVRERPRDKPFFMWFASYDAHRVWGPNIFSGSNDPDRITPPVYLAEGIRTRRDLASYYDEITRFDHYIGLVYEELVKQDAAENTLIIIMADNGRPFPHSKTRVNDRGLKTPFIIHWPAGAGSSAKICNSLVSSIDIAPTVLEAASAGIPETVQGVSFLELIGKPGRKFRDFVFAEHNWHDYEAHERMVRSKDYLFILNSRPQFPQSGPADAVGSPSYAELDSLRKAGAITSIQEDIFTAPRKSEELYNLKTDPDQFRNIAGTKKYLGKQKKMRQILDEWMSATGDNIPGNITRDWYIRAPGYIRTPDHSIRGESAGTKYNATLNNNKGRF